MGIIVLETDVVAEDTCEEKLFTFLYNARAHHRAPELLEMFNAEFSTQRIIGCSFEYLQTHLQQYEAVICDNTITVDGMRYVHPANLDPDKSASRRLNRCLEKCPSNALLVQDRCVKHSKKCRLVEFYHGFVCYMYLQTVGESETSQSTTFGSCQLAPKEEVGNVEVQFDPEEERVEVSKETFDAGLIFASLADATIGCKQESQNKEETLPLNYAPSFAMAKDSHYILLKDIMHGLNIHEDYCLAAIANFCESDIGFVDNEVDQHLIADTAIHDSQFTSGWQLVKDTFNEAKSGESNFPIDEQFKLTTKQLGLENMGRPVAPIAQAMNSHSIHLWGRSMLEMDENQMVLVYDDSFLRRVGGSRQGLVTGVEGKDAALSHYIGCFNHKKIIIYHKEYSDDNAKFPLFAMKVITRLCGGHSLPINAERVILIEKQFALCIFGIEYGCQALRAPYFMSYTAQALAAGVEDPESLDPYNKRLFLRERRCLMLVGMLPSIEEGARLQSLHIDGHHIELVFLL
ncbi:hypothetical protein L7F22_004807 [Adiantum nelumboides]|nr:hypothetical protein [Adiantum nelumboides]